ncbi:hypothetical protein pb186bvf_008064 [Paramecium bursaria]
MNQPSYKHLPVDKKIQILRKLGHKPKKEQINQVCSEHQIHASTVKHWIRTNLLLRLEDQLTGGNSYQRVGNPVQEETFQVKQLVNQNLDEQIGKLQHFLEHTKKMCSMIAEKKTYQGWPYKMPS